MKQIRYIQMWLPGFEPRTEQPDLPGFGDEDDIEPSEGEVRQCGHTA